MKLDRVLVGTDVEKTNVACLLNSDLLFTDPSTVFYIEFGVSLKHVSAEMTSL